MKKSRVKKIATWVVVPLMVGIFLLDIVVVAVGNCYLKNCSIEQESFSGKYDDDRIHFLNTGASDAILIESNGMFALIDSGEGNNNPRRKTDYRGYEDDVVSYLKKAAADASGKVTLEFVLGTHYHYDHIGAFHAIISDKDITVKTGYFKQYNSSIDTDYEDAWGLEGTYKQVIADLVSEGAQVVDSLPAEPFEFGDFTVQFFNTVNSPDAAGRGENAASVGVKLTKGKKSAFLAADITASTGLEKSIAAMVGDVDLLKIGHHGYYGSSSMSFLRALRPEITVVTNRLGKIYPNVKWNLTMVAKAPVFATVDNNGIIASFTDGGDIILTNNIH